MNSNQRNYLRKEAHALKPVVMIGQNGLSESVVKASEQALASHELIKIKFQDYKDEKRSLAEDLAAKTGSDVVSLIGNILTLYRQSADLEKRRFRLPS